MPETDPFGRDKSEDPLAEMGWSGGESSPAPDITPTDTSASDVITSDPASPERPVPPAPGARRPPAPPSRYRPMGPTISGGIPGQRATRRLGCAFAVVVLGMIGAIGAFAIPAIISAVDEVGDTIDDATPTVPGVDEPTGGGGDGDRRERRERDRPSRPPTSPFSETSLLRRGNLAPALKRLQRITKSSRVRLIRIDAQSIVVQTALPDGRTRLARATWQGDASVLSTVSTGGGPKTFPWSRIDPSVPNRIARASLGGKRPSTFDYVVLVDIIGLKWRAFLKSGGQFQANLDGRGVTKVG
jgi:hypothetical protein